MKSIRVNKLAVGGFFFLTLVLLFWIGNPFGAPALGESAAASSLSTSTVVVEVSGPGTMGAVALMVDYDEALVAFEGVVTSGVAVGGLVMPNDDPEQGRVKVGLIKASGFESGEVLRLSFRIVCSGLPDEGSFEVAVLTVMDLEGYPFPTARAVFSVHN